MLDSKDCLGEVVAAHRLARDVLILLGWSADPIATEGFATFADRRGERGRFRAAAWAAEAAGQRWFIAVINVAGVGDSEPGQALRLRGAGAANPVVACVPKAIADHGSFAAELALRLGSHADAAAHFLLEAFGSEAARELETVRRLLGAVLDAAAEEEGIIEILGPIEGEGLLVQGWTRRSAPGRQRILAVSDALVEGEAFCAAFPRSDIEAPAAGFIALIRAGGRSAVLRSAPEHLYLQCGNRFCRLTILAEATQLRGDAAPHHLRDMLPVLQADAGTQRLLRAAAGPRFTGIDTVSTSEHPVRMAVDLAAHFSGAGWYLTGWMLDPARLVTAVTLMGRDGSAERIDERWTRVLREDVSNAFVNDTLFKGRFGDHRHGFTMFVPHGPERRVWLELTLANEQCLFMPLDPVSAESWDQRRRILTSYDQHKPTARDIVERQLGPFFHAAKAAKKILPGHRTLRDGGAIAPEGAAPLAVLAIALTEPDCPLNLVVSGLATCPPGAGIAPLFVCSPVLGDRVSDLLRALAFYGLEAAVIIAEAPIGRATAFEIGVSASRSETMIFLSPGCYATNPGWAAQLAAALGTNAAVSPTLLYEDWSIRFAGLDGVQILDTAPYAEFASNRAGYPRGALASAAITPSFAAAIECCAVHRQAFERVGGFNTAYTSPVWGGLDLFLRMRAAEMTLAWLPAVELFALDNAGEIDPYAAGAAELIDAWHLRESWRTRMPGPVDAPIRRAELPAAPVRSADRSVASIRNTDRSAAPIRPQPPAPAIYAAKVAAAFSARGTV